MAPLYRAHTAENRVFRRHYDTPIRQRALLNENIEVTFNVIFRSFAHCASRNTQETSDSMLLHYRISDGPRAHNDFCMAINR